MYERVAVYTYQEDKMELEAKARAGVLPIVTSTPGYISYGVMFNDEHVVSVSTWESEDTAKVADAAIIDWVKSNTTMQLQSRFAGDLAWIEMAETTSATVSAARRAPKSESVVGHAADLGPLLGLDLYSWFQRCTRILS